MDRQEEIGSESIGALDAHPGTSAVCLLSGGAFNRSVQHQSQSIGRGFEAQGLSRALIEPQRN